MLEPGDLLMSAAGTVGKAHLWSSKEAACFAGFLVRFRANQAMCDPRFIGWWSQGKGFKDQVLTGAVRSTINNFSAGKYRALRVFLPELSYQRSIADFLDRETAQIDAMIEAQEALATIAGERRRAVIHHYVTKGLATGASLKNTPLKWLGEIPEHWEVANIRRHAEMKTGHTPSRSVPEYWVDCDIPWITLADVWQLRTGKIEYIENTDEMVSELGIANSAAELLPAGTVVLSRTASVGFSGIMATPMATSQDYWNWICKPSMLPEYLLYVFRAMEQEFQALRRGSTHQTIYQPVAASFRIPVPPLDEQRQIVEELRQTLRRTDELLEEIAATTALLRERREALITAAVTGRIDPETGIEYPENPETPKES
jgi:type I restriction enzyme S subunit